jgi:hypothetical protein
MYLYIVSPYTKSVRTYVHCSASLHFAVSFYLFFGQNWYYYFRFFLCQLEFFFSYLLKTQSPNFWYHKKVWYGVYRRNPCFLRLVFIRRQSLYTTCTYVRTYVHRAALAFPSLWASLRLFCVRGSVARIARSLGASANSLTEEEVEDQERRKSGE